MGEGISFVDNPPPDDVNPALFRAGAWSSPDH